jgi:hypothetical protein
MEPIHIQLTAAADTAILDCLRCDTALLPAGEWPSAAPTKLQCPLCSWEQPVEIVELGGEAVFPFNIAEQQRDAEATPVYQVASLTVDEDLVLVDVPDLLADEIFFALQNGVAPVASFGWVGGTGLLGDEGYRLLLVVRVHDHPEEDLFRVEVPAALLGELSAITMDRTLVLVSQGKGVFFPESGEVYLQAIIDAGGNPGEPLSINTWVQLQDSEAP